MPEQIHLHLISYKQAKFAGHQKYFDGSSCFKGHLSEKTLGGGCIACRTETKKPKKSRPSTPPTAEEQIAAKKIRAAKYRAAHPEQKNADNARRRANRLRVDGKFIGEHILKMLDVQEGKCNACFTWLVIDGKNNYHVDHIMPLVLGGTNWPDNLQLLCPRCNMKKGSKHPDEWRAMVESGVHLTLH